MAGRLYLQRVVLIKGGTDLASLRDREDFKQLLTDLEAASRNEMK